MPLDLYAIGNALVDREYPIDDAFLTRCNLQKGTMQLADAVQQQQLMHLLNQHSSSTGQVSGGSAANTAFAFAALGGSAFYACRVGNDDAGRFYLADLASAGVHTSAQSQSTASPKQQDESQQSENQQSDGETGTCLVMVSPDGERTMHTHLGITAELSPDQVDLAPLDQARFLYIEGYLATSASARQAVTVVRELARQQGSKIALSLSDPAMVQYARDGLLKLIGQGVDLLFCNDLEAKMLTQTDSTEAAIEALHAYAPMVVVTRGAEGALIGHSGVFLPVAPQVVPQVLDTNGAGDGFAGGFLFGLSQNFTLSDCGVLATAVASQVVAQYGPRLPRQQYADILANMVQLSSV